MLTTKSQNNFSYFFYELVCHQGDKLLNYKVKQLSVFAW